MHFLSSQVILFVIFYLIVNIGDLLVNIYILELLPKPHKLRLKSIHQLTESILNPFLIFKHGIGIQALNLMELFHQFFVRDYLTSLGLVVVRVTGCADEGIAFLADYGNADLVAFVLVCGAFWIVMHVIFYYQNIIGKGKNTVSV